MLSILMLIGGLALILVGANLLVDGASSLAKRLRISDLVIGLTVVAFGTSSPELTVSVYSGMTGRSDIALGNVVGSNIFNVLVILGLAAVFYPIKVQSSTVYKEIPFAFLAALLLLFGANDPLLDGAAEAVFSRIDGLFMLGFFAIFLYYTFDLTRKHRSGELHNIVVVRPLWSSVLLLAAGLVMLVLGGRWTVDGAVDIASRLGISQSVIGLTIIAMGTSLPELATSLVAAYKRNSDIALGNVVGSNIFNIFLILGTAGTISPLGLGNITNFDLLVCAGSALILQIFAFNHRISRLEGGILFALYIAYVVFLLAGQSG